MHRTPAELIFTKESAITRAGGMGSTPFYALSLLRDFERDSNNSKEAFRNRVSQRTGGRCWIDRTWELCATKKNWLITPDAIVVD